MKKLVTASRALATTNSSIHRLSNPYFGELVAAKILSPAKDGKEVYYINDDLIQILKG